MLWIATIRRGEPSLGWGGGGKAMGGARPLAKEGEPRYRDRGSPSPTAYAAADGLNLRRSTGPVPIAVAGEPEGAGRWPVVSWPDLARCVDLGNELFFGDTIATYRAKAFCSICPVWWQCLAEGVGEDHRIWGGLSRAERRRLQRLQQRPAFAPTDPANAIGVRLLLRSGLSPDRLSELTGLEVGTILDNTRTIRRRRRSRRPSRRQVAMAGTP